jgi:hypothetical protein
MGAEAEAASAARGMIPAVSVEPPVQVRQALERARAARAGFDNAVGAGGSDRPLPPIPHRRTGVMPRRPTGSIVEHTGKDGSRTVPCGSVHTGTASTSRSARSAATRPSVSCAACSPTSSAAHGKLHQSPQAAEPVIDPTFHEFAELWWVERERELHPAMRGLPLAAREPPDPVLRPAHPAADHDRGGRPLQGHEARRGHARPAVDQHDAHLLGALLEAAAQRELPRPSPLLDPKILAL